MQPTRPLIGLLTTACTIAIMFTATTMTFAEATLDGVRLGSHVTGPKLTPSDLKGRVVVFEYWGVNCGPCVAAIPHVSDLATKYNPSQIVFVANHCQQGGVAAARSVWTSRAKSDLVTVIDQGRLPGANVSGIPRVFVFDHTGELVFDGRPMKMDAAIASAVSKSPGFLVAGGQYAKLASVARQLGRLRGNLTSAIKRVRAGLEAEDTQLKAEATDLMQRVEAWVAGELAKIDQFKADDPRFALEVADRMATYLRGDALGEKFAKIEAEMKADKQVMATIKSAVMLEKIEAVAADIGLSADPDKCKANRRNHGKIRQIAAGLKQLEEDYAQTPAAQQAAGYRTKWGL